MIDKAVNKKLIQYAIMAIMCISTLVCIFPPNFLFFKWITNFAFHLMLFHFFSGILFLTIRQPKLTFVAFGASAILCLFLKQASNTDFSPPTPTNAPSIKIAHFNLSNSSESPTETINIIKNTQADLISLQEITPFWDSLLRQQLQPYYPFHYITHDVNIFGLAIYAKQEFQSIDTFSYHNIPNIIGSLTIDDSPTDIHFISTLTRPPASYKDYTLLKKHLHKVSEQCNNINEPLLAFGDYNVVPWSNEIQEFRHKAHLLDSRRGFMPTYPNGALHFFWAPLDHIFFSSHFKCLNFGTISGETSQHLGIQGVFQINEKQ